MVRTTPTAASSSASPSPFKKKPVFRTVVDAAPSGVGVREGKAVSALSSSNDECCGLAFGGGRSPCSSASDCAGGAFHPFVLPPPPRRVSDVETSSSSLVPTTTTITTTTTTSSPTTIIFREAAVDWATTTTPEELGGGSLRSPLMLLQRANPIRDGAYYDGDGDGDADGSESSCPIRGHQSRRRRSRDDLEDDEEMGYSRNDGTRSNNSSSRRRRRSPSSITMAGGEEWDPADPFRAGQEDLFVQPFVSLENVLNKLPSPGGGGFGGASAQPAAARTTWLLPRRQPWNDNYDHHPNDDDLLDATTDDDDHDDEVRLQPRHLRPDDGVGMDENEIDQGGGGRQPTMVDYSRFFETDLFNDRIVLLCDSHANDEDGDCEGEDYVDLWRGPNRAIGLLPTGGVAVTLADVVGVDGDEDDDFSLSSEEASSILDTTALAGGNGGAEGADAFWEEGFLGA